MKLKSIVLTGGLFVMTSLTANSQTTMTGHVLSGVLPLSPTQYLGSSNAADVIFRSNNLERMRILSTGNVGINTGLLPATLPQRRFVVSNGGLEGIELHPFATGLGYSQIIGFRRAINGANPVGYIPLVLQDAAGGNVGIGETNPLAKLHVNGNTLLSGTVGNNFYFHNTTGNTGIGNYSPTALPTAKLAVQGAIESTFPIPGMGIQNTLFFGYTPETGNPGPPFTTDGFRMKFDNNFLAQPNNDAWIFEKTDCNSPSPDGYIAFTNTGNNNIERLSMMIAGNGRVGIGRNFSFAFPMTNRLVIDGDPGDPYQSLPAGSSGLQFVDMNSGASPMLNPGTGVLAVDALGNVIYVPGSAGNYCQATTSNPLAGDDFEIPLGGFNYRFTGQSVPLSGTTNTDVVGVGYACGQTMPAKFNVLQNVGTTLVNTSAASFINHDIDLSNLTLTYRGVVGLADGVQPGGGASNIGGEFRGNNAPLSYGVKASASSSLTSGTNYAGYFSATTVGAPANIGIFAQGLNSTTTNLAGWFVGDVTINGVGTITSGTWLPSDKQFKKEINAVENSLETLMKLQPKSYLYDTENKYKINFYDKKQFGFIAQELEEVIPELVKETTMPERRDEEGNIITEAVTFKTVNYDGLIAFLVKGTQEQQSQIENQQKQIDELKKLISSTPTINSNENATNIELTDGQSIILDQNVPNPFAEQTTITYTLTDGVQKAQMLFYNSQGKLINVQDLQTKSGKSQLNVFAQDLSNGVYTYTLVVDGKIIETKKMIKQ